MVEAGGWRGGEVRELSTTLRTGGAAVLRAAASGHWRERRPGTRRKRSFLLRSGLPCEWKTGTGWTEEEESRGGGAGVVLELLEDWVTRLDASSFVACVLEMTDVVGLDVGVVLAEVVVVVFSILSSSLNRFLACRVKLGDWK